MARLLVLATAVAVLFAICLSGTEAAPVLPAPGPLTSGEFNYCTSDADGYHAFLVDLYNLCDGPNWSLGTPWNITVCPCDPATKAGIWEGIECESEGVGAALGIDVIDLKGAGLNCTLPQDWHQRNFNPSEYFTPSTFNALRRIDLSDNPLLTGAVPTVFDSVQPGGSYPALLEKIDISNTGITSLDFAEPQTTLETLVIRDLGLTDLSAAGLDEADAPALISLDVENNNLQTLADLIQDTSGYSNLEILKAGFNSMTGGIPASLRTSYGGGLGLLEVFLNDNQLNGTVNSVGCTSGVDTSSAVRILDISNNQLIGTMPDPGDGDVSLENNMFPCPQSNVPDCVCDPGYVAPSAAGSCSACAAGSATFQEQPRAPSICTDCSNSTASLPEATYCTLGCPAGAYLDQPQICAECTGGLVSAANATECTDTCPLNTELTTLTACTACPSGTYSAPPAACAACQPGQFVNTTGEEDQCSDCPAQTVSGVANADLCSPCLLATEANANQTACVPCDANEANLGTGNGCEVCPAGFVPAGDQLSCVQCQAGEYENAAGDTCLACPSGYSSPAGASSAGQCFPCPAGTAALGVPATCSNCTAGTSTNGLLAQTSCFPCTGDGYSGSGYPSCLSCGAGRQSTAGATACEDCTASTASVAGSASAEGSQCTTCLAGHEALVDTASICTDCPVGTVSADGRLCAPCDGGEAPNVDQDVCLPCTAGSYAQPGDPSCTPCGVGHGTYANQTGCFDCPSGHVSASGIACSPCAAGTSPSTDLSTCDPCDPGYVSEPMESSCSQCAVNTFQDGSDHTTCVPCPAGSNSTVGATSCFTCPSGREPDGGSCAICPIGMYGPGGGHACAPCGIGMYNPSPDASYCLECASNTDNPTASTCGPGSGDDDDDDDDTGTGDDDDGNGQQVPQIVQEPATLATAGGLIMLIAGSVGYRRRRKRLILKRQQSMGKEAGEAAATAGAGAGAGAASTEPESSDLPVKLELPDSAAPAAVGGIEASIPAAKSAGGRSKGSRGSKKARRSSGSRGKK